MDRLGFLSDPYLQPQLYMKWFDRTYIKSLWSGPFKTKTQTTLCFPRESLYFLTMRTECSSCSFRKVSLARISTDNTFFEFVKYICSDQVINFEALIIDFYERIVS